MVEKNGTSRMRTVLGRARAADRPIGAHNAGGSSSASASASASSSDAESGLVEERGLDVVRGGHAVPADGERHRLGHALRGVGEALSVDILAERARRVAHRRLERVAVHVQRASGRGAGIAAANPSAPRSCGEDPIAHAHAPRGCGAMPPVAGGRRRRGAPRPLAAARICGSGRTSRISSGRQCRNCSRSKYEDWDAWKLIPTFAHATHFAASPFRLFRSISGRNCRLLPVPLGKTASRVDHAKGSFAPLEGWRIQKRRSIPSRARGGFGRVRVGGRANALAHPE